MREGGEGGRDDWGGEGREGRVRTREGGNENRREGEMVKTRERERG